MKRALVTGASRGIGRHLALALAADGWDLALLATRKDRLSAVREEIRASNPRAAIVRLGADVRDPRAVEAAVRHAESWLGGIDLVVNNAGRVDQEVPLWQADPQEWADVLATNVLGPFHLMRYVIPGMIQGGGGRIIDINSGAGTRDFPDMSAYVASKTALLRLGAGVHLAGGPHGIRTFELAPGVVATDMTAGMRAHIGRTEWTEPAEVAALVLAIAHGEADHLSGSYLRVGLDRPGELAGRRTRRVLGLLEEATAPRSL